MSAADEVAVARFLAGEIRYTDIVRLVTDAVAQAPDIACDSIDAVLEADRIARIFAHAWRG